MQAAFRGLQEGREPSRQNLDTPKRTGRGVRIGGSPVMVQVEDAFIRYARAHVGVTFLRKDTFAQVVPMETDPWVDDSEATFNGE